MSPPTPLASHTTVSIIRLLNRGLTQRDVANQLNLRYNTVNSVAQKWKRNGYKNLVLDVDNREPSPAAQRLALFDPIIARALQQRKEEGN